MSKIRPAKHAGAPEPFRYRPTPAALGSGRPADLQCFAAVAESDAAKSRAHFDAALARWDGASLNDDATSHSKLYATYKLALVLHAARRFDIKTPALPAMHGPLLKMQADTGGWITGYKPYGTPVGMANVGTTSLAILALDAALPPALAGGAVKQPATGAAR